MKGAASTVVAASPGGCCRRKDAQTPYVTVPAKYSFTARSANMMLLARQVHAQGTHG
jgi:hypothetical protein